MLPVITGWIGVMERVVEGRGEYGRYRMLVPVAQKMLRKLEGEIDDAEMMFGWFVLMLLDVSFGGDDVWSVYRQVMKWEKCKTKFGGGAPVLVNVYGRREERHVDPREFLGTNLWKAIRSEWLKYIETLTEDKHFPPDWGHQEHSDEVEGGCMGEGTMGEITNRPDKSTDTAVLGMGSNKRKSDNLFSVLAHHEQGRKKSRVRGGGKGRWAPRCEGRHIDQFIAERMEMERDEGLDVLQWWEGSQKRWPWLAHLARLYLAQPATSATSERLFSVAGNVMRQTRNRLSGSNLELLTCLAWNLPRTLF